MNEWIKDAQFPDCGEKKPVQYGSDLAVVGPGQLVLKLGFNMVMVFVATLTKANFWNSNSNFELREEERNLFFYIAVSYECVVEDSQQWLTIDLFK